MKPIDRLVTLYKVYQNVVEDIHVPDLKPRTWKERLFTWPWTPWVKTKYSPRAYILNDGTIVVSPRTKKLLEEALLSDKYSASSV